MSTSIPPSSHFMMSQPPTGSPLLDSESKSPPKSVHSGAMANSVATVPEPSVRRQSIKGTFAKFHFQNPRFINAPIAHLASREKCNSVQDCFEWSSVEERCSKESVCNVKRSNVPCKDNKEM